MSTSSAVIVLMRVELEWRAVIFGTLGAIPGAILGFHLVSDFPFLFVLFEKFFTFRYRLNIYICKGHFVHIIL